MKNRFAILLLIVCLPAASQQLEAEPPPKGEPRPPPYLANERVDFREFVGVPPAAGSFWDREEQRIVEMLQGTASDERWRSAELDSQYLYPRFSEAFGQEIDRKQLPHTVRLLNRMLRDVGYSSFQAKNHFRRLRPFQRARLKRICGSDTVPMPEENPKERSSYPSGHSAYGWAVAMILAKLKPERSEQLFQRAATYGESRLVCGVHYPSDVASGHVIAAAVISRLQGNAEFRADLERARTEYPK